jgi:hypothetical protein
MSFTGGQKLAPMVEQRAMHLDTVILDIRKNANWPLRTEFRRITTHLPATEDEREARIKQETEDHPDWTDASRHLVRSDIRTMTNDLGVGTR